MQVNKSGEAPPPVGTKSQAEKGPAPRDNLEEFQRHYRREGREGDSGSGRFGGSSGKQPEEPRLENLSSIFSSLLSGTESGPSPSASTQTAGPAGNFDDLVSGLVDRILTSSVEQGGTQEVRLLVSPNILPDTEIRLSRDIDGLLSVTLVTGRDDSFQTLVAAQDSLRAALSGQEKQEVRLTVTAAGESGAGEAGTGEEGSTDRRSRGYFQYEPDDNA